MSSGGSYSTVQASRISGLTYRQIDYMVRTRLVEASLLSAAGSGTQRRWSGADVDRLVLIAKLLKAGVSMERIRRDRNPEKTAAAVVKALEPYIAEVV